MDYDASLIHMTEELESSDSMYSLICLKASALSLTLNGVRCFLDGHYLLCLSVEDTLTVHGGRYEVLSLRFLPYFYNVNLSHNVIGLSMYGEMRSRYGYPDFHFFRQRGDEFIGILPLSDEEYDVTRLHFEKAKQHIDAHDTDGMWSCRTRSDMISILRIAEGAGFGQHFENGSEILRYIRENLGEELTLSSLSRRFHTNRTTLTETVKRLTGMSPMQYVLEERLNQSRPDLLFTRVPIGELSEKYGFSSVNYYIRAFKKRFGVSPLKYRVDGYAERIRNENIYHEREREFMKVEDFKGYLEKGIGRAVILLKKQEDKSPFWQPLFDHITGYDPRYRLPGAFEKELIECFDDSAEKAKELAGVLLSKIERGENTACVKLLIELGYGDAVLNAVEGMYKRSYAELLDFCEKGDSEEKYPTCSIHYADAVIALFRASKDRQRLKQALFDMADLYDHTDHPVVPEERNPLFVSMDVMGKTEMFVLLDEVAREHPHGKKLDIRNTRHHIIPKWPPSPIDDLTAADIIESDDRDLDRYLRLFVSFAKADEDLVKEVSEKLLAEKDIMRQIHLMSFFVEVIPEIKPAEFTLDPSVIVEFADKNKENVADLSTSRFTDADHYFRFLCYVRHPCVRSFAQRLLAEHGDIPALRLYGMKMLYGVNYEPKDREGLAKLILSDDPREKDAAFAIFTQLIRCKTPGSPTELVSYVFENIHGITRRSFVSALIEGEKMTKEILEECRYDADPFIRKLASRCI